MKLLGQIIYSLILLVFLNSTIEIIKFLHRHLVDFWPHLDVIAALRNEIVALDFHGQSIEEPSFIALTEIFIELSNICIEREIVKNLGVL